MSKPSTTPIVALDMGNGAEALAMVDRLGDSCRFYKVGSELFTGAGPVIVSELRSRGVDVFLDLKFHDIPNTVAGAVRSAARLGARLLTVHASGGAAMIRAAVDAAGASAPDGPGGGAKTPRILAVTLLTSLRRDEVETIWGRQGGDGIDVLAEVIRLAEQAADAGAHGIVCSGLEAGPVKERLGDRLEVLVPGVRLPGDQSQDQARVVTPGDAARFGARYIVLGRTVTGAPDPLQAMQAVLSELRKAG